MAKIVTGKNHSKKEVILKKAATLFKTKSFSVDGEYDFAVDIGSSINDTQRFEAISRASDMAVTDILSRVAVSSFK